MNYKELIKGKANDGYCNWCSIKSIRYTVIGIPGKLCTRCLMDHADSLAYRRVS